MTRVLFTLIFCCVLSFISNVSAATDDFYKIGADDMLEIRVLGHDDLKTLTVVTTDGTITFPYIGTVYVKEMTLQAIEQEITKRLGDGYIKYPVVTVSLVKSESKKIFSYGELYRRGAIPYEDNLSLLKAISIAGGMTENGRYGKVKLRRYKKGNKDYKDIEIDAESIIEGSKVGEMLLQPDDILIVEKNMTFFAHGEVARPGEYALERDMTLMKALSLAGGLQVDGLHGRVKIKRKTKDGSGYENIETNMRGISGDDKSGDMLLQPDDIVIVERNKTFLIQGEVMNRGRFVLEKDFTVLRALLQAGGASTDGLHGRIKLRRKREGAFGEYADIVEAKLHNGVIGNKEVEDTLLEPDDILIVERNITFLIQGEVMNRGRFVLEKDMTVLRALLQAGGISGDGLYGKIKVRRKQGDSGVYKDIVEARLSNGIIENREIEDTLLEPDDVLVVERNEKFLVYGEVVKPGEYVLQNDMTAFKAITLAAGLTKWGASNKVKVLRKNGDSTTTLKVNIAHVMDGDADADIKLQAGDVVIVSSGMF